MHMHNPQFLSLLLFILLNMEFKEKSFPGGSDGKASVYNVRDLGSIPGLERSPGEGKSFPGEIYGLYRVGKSMNESLSDFHFQVGIHY